MRTLTEEDDGTRRGGVAAVVSRDDLLFKVRLSLDDDGASSWLSTDPLRCSSQGPSAF